jgi:hypothetical protein
MTTTKCRAKTPATCRVHGTNNPVNAILDYKVAASYLRASKKTVALATNLEELSEAKELVMHDQMVYDATLQGQDELKTKMQPWQTPRPALSEILEYESRYAEAVAFRKETLANDPAHAESETKFNDFVKENVEASYDINVKDRKTIYNNIKKLEELPYGTPVALKLQNGGYIYDKSGNGYKNGSSGVLGKIFNAKGRFIQTQWGDEADRVNMSLASSHTLFPLKEVSEIHVLKPDAYKNGFSQFQNSHTSSDIDDGRDNARWAAEGKEYYYELEGRDLTPRENVTFYSGGVFLQPEKIISLKKFNVA